MATLSKEDIELFNFIINDPESGEAEKKIAKEVLAKNTPSKEIPTRVKSSAKKPVTKKATSKKPSEMTTTDLEKKKKALLKKVGKTEEECEKIIAQYRALKSEKKTQVKKDTARKETAKKRTKKLKKEGKTIQGTTEKNVEATLDTVSKKVVKKIDKEVEKIEKTSKTEKQVEKKISSLVTQAVRSNKKLLSDTAKELAKVDKNNAKQYLMSLKKEIETLLSKYADGGMLPTPFGQAGLVGETGTLNEVDLFAMGGTLPQGVHQYYAQTYNPAYPTPYGYAKGGMITSAPEYHKVRNAEYDRRVKSGKIKDTDDNFERFDEMYFDELVEKGRIDPDNYFAKGGNVEDGKVYELKAYFVDVEKDSYDEGVLDSVHSWDSSDMGNYEMKKFNSKQDLYNALSKIIYRDTDKYPKKEFYGMDEDSDGNVTLTYDTMCAYKNDVYVEPTSLEVDLWKQGEMELFNVRHFFVVDVYKKERLEFAKGGSVKKELEGYQGMYDYAIANNLTPSQLADELEFSTGLKDERDKKFYAHLKNLTRMFPDKPLSEFAKGGMTTSDKHAKIIADLEKIQSEVTDRPPYVFERDGQLFVSSEEGDEFSDYYGEYYEPMYIDRRLEAIAEKNGGYWDWENAGSIVFVDDSFAKGGNIDENKAHFSINQDNQIYVDSNFINMSQNALSNSKLKHLGFGEFYLETPNGDVQFIRTDFRIKGFVGRTHRLGGNSNAGLDLLDAMKSKSQQVSGERFAKGGMMQGYNDRLDESLGNRNSVEPLMMQSYKDRRDESKGMEKSMGRRPYSSVGTMDKMAKGGKTQGYNDKLDESLGNRNSVEPIMKQSFKDRRNESEAMEKKGGKRKYASVKTMDKGSRKKRKTPMTLAKEIRKEGEKWQDAVKRASAMLKKK